MLHFITPALALAAAADIAWEADYEAALGRAQSENRAVFVALHGQQDARCEAFAKRLYKDRAVVAAAAETVNIGATIEELDKRKHPFVKGMKGLENRRLAASLRESLVPANDGGIVATPQHLWLSPSGEILLSVPYEMEEGELLWCFNEAARLIDPATGAPPEGARAPRRLLYGEGYRPHNADELARGLTEDELDETIEEVRSSTGRRGFGRRFTNLLRIAFTDEKDALDYITIELGNGLLTWSGNGVLIQSLHVVGVLSPASFWRLIEGYVAHDDADVRREAAVALEQFGAADALKVARRGFSKEKEGFLQAAWLRAIGACARDDRSARKQLLDVAADQDDEKTRASAIFALGYLDPHEDVRAFLVATVRGSAEPERSMAACAMALSRDRYYEGVLAGMVEAGAAEGGAAEGDPGEGEAGAGARDSAAGDAVLEDALKVLRGAELARIASHVSRATGALVKRERVFFENGSVRGRIDFGGRGR